MHIPPIGWWYFSKSVKRPGRKLLYRLPEYENPILVTGCQRSGTTVLRRALSQSYELSEFWTEKDDELEGARILAGIKNIERSGRYCFQTTYLNEYYTEYFELQLPAKVIWVTRDPFSVVRSMLYNWKRFPLNELFNACGRNQLTDREVEKYKRFGVIGISALKRACYSYNGKLHQLLELRSNLGDDVLYVVDYEDLINNPDRLRQIYEFVDLEYSEDYGKIFKKTGLAERQKLTHYEIDTIHSICSTMYEEAMRFVS
ncbi:MAG: sulfotransferase [Candidatus Thiodiazotropha sp.]